MHIRNTRPLLVADFWGDGTLTGGCLSGGRKYIHINNKGDVEPCIFAHFATDNIKDKPLIDCLCSDFFNDLRRMQPFGKNLLRALPHHRPPGGDEEGRGAQQRVSHARWRRDAHQRVAARLHVYAKQVREVLPRLAERSGRTSGWRPIPTTTSAAREAPMPTRLPTKPASGDDKVGARD